MRIAQVAPLYESVPPKLYGGTERVVSYLTEELVTQEHEVTLFASGDSSTQARLISPCPFSLRLQEGCVDQIAHHFTMLEMIQEEIKNFDIVHYHIDYIHYPLSKRSSIPHITTLHGCLDIPDLVHLYKKYKNIPVVSISNNQRFPFPDINWKKTIYHGLPENLYKAYINKGKYLAFIGRFSPEKAADRAIEVAIKAGIPIKLAAKVDKVDRDYFNAVIKPLLNHPLVEYIGEIGENEKDEFLGNALALLFLIDWPEPFGLAMIEAMACGTPVIAWNTGSVPEIIDEGISGYIVNSIEKAKNAISKVLQLNRQKVRDAFVKRFSVRRMAMEYVGIYKEMISSEKNLKKLLNKQQYSNADDPRSLLFSQ